MRRYDHYQMRQDMEYGKYDNTKDEEKSRNTTESIQEKRRSGKSTNITKSIQELKVCMRKKVSILV